MSGVRGEPPSVLACLGNRMCQVISFLIHGLERHIKVLVLLGLISHSVLVRFMNRQGTVHGLDALGLRYMGHYARKCRPV